MRKRKRGFTILELLLTILVLVIVFFPLLQAISSGLLAGHDTQFETEALNIARQKLEESRNLGFGSVASVAKTAHTVYPQYQYQIDVVDTQTNLRQVTAAVYWNSPSGAELNVSLTTYISSF